MSSVFSTFYFTTESVSPTSLYSALLTRISFLLPQCHGVAGHVRKQSWRLTGKMYRGRVAVDGATRTICSLSTVDDRENDGDGDGDDENCASVVNTGACYLINNVQWIKTDRHFDAILNKLNLMYSARQSYGIDGARWMMRCGDGDTELVRCATINSGAECVGVVVEIAQGAVDEIVKGVFAEFMTAEHMEDGAVRMIPFVAKTAAVGVELADAAKYLDLIFQAGRLTA